MNYGSGPWILNPGIFDRVVFNPDPTFELKPAEKFENRYLKY